ncbi:MAG: rod shape-determining protein MreC [bacterium]
MEYLRRNRILFASASLLLCSLLLVSVSVRSPIARDPVGRLLLDALAPFQVVFGWVGRGVGRVWGGYVAVVDARQENEQLRAQVAALDGELLRVGEVERENQRLAALLSLRSQLAGTVYGARVIGRDPSPMAMTLTIDRGERDGVHRGLAVVAPQGVVGQVAEASYTAARVVLLTSHNSGIDAIVQRSRARGVVKGGTDNTCRMDYLMRDADVQVGDRILTSGLDGIFPKGLVVGEVVELGRSNRGLLQAATVRPTVDLEKLEEVLVVDPTATVADEPPA